MSTSTMWLLLFVVVALALLVAALTKTKFTVQKISIIGVMAALSLVAYEFFRIPNVFGSGSSFHLGNTFTALTAMLLDGVSGGLAGAIGLALADILAGDPGYAITTFILKFIIGLVCGFVAHKVIHLKDYPTANRGKYLLVVTASAFSGLLVNVFTDPFIGYFRNRFIFGQPGKHNDHITKLLIVGETVSVPGGWIGFPAHRHDYERPGKECVLDEIFSFQMTSTEDGPGRGGVMQHGYDLTDENKKIWDEVNVIEENNTAVALPTGYHTTVALPGTRAYLLWGLAGDTKKYKVQFDERYSWLEGCLY